MLVLMLISVIPYVVPAAEAEKPSWAAPGLFLEYESSGTSTTSVRGNLVQCRVHNTQRFELVRLVDDRGGVFRKTWSYFSDQLWPI